MSYQAQCVQDLGDTVVVDQDGFIQSAERCAQVMNDRDALKKILGDRALDLARSRRSNGELLAALERLLDVQNGLKLREWQDAIDAARAAIARGAQ